jgi:hypothetical protein
MKFTGMRLSDPRVKDVLLSDVTDADYLYFVDDETGVTFRIRIGVLRAAIGGGGGGVSDATRRLYDADGVVDAGKRLFSTLPTDYGRDIWIEPGVAAEQRWLQLPGNAALGTVLRVRYGGTLENGETTLRFGGNSDADGLNLLITPSGVYSGLREGYVLTLVHAERIEDDGEWLHAWWVLSETHVPVPANLAEVLDDLEAAVDAVEATANNALPKPGGTTTANGIVTGSGTAGAAVAVSTTTVGALVGSIAFADDKATDALSSYAQASHTGARTLATTDAGDTIPLTGAALFTIPHTLFGAAGTNRAFGCCIEVKTGGVPTFAGSGGIAIIYHGKSSGWAVGEMIWVEVTSATTAHVFTSLVTP